MPYDAPGSTRRGRPPAVALALVTTSSLALLDTATGFVVAGLLAVGPCLAAVSGRPRAVLAVGGYSAALISLLAWRPDQIWGTEQHLVYLLAIAAVTAVGVAVAGRLSELRHAQSRAEGHRRAFAAIVEHSPDAIVAVSLDGTITAWNSGAEELYGYAATEMVGQPGSTFHARVRPPDADGTDTGDVQARILGGERHVRYDTRRVHRDGRIRDVSMTVSAILDDDGAVVGIASICRDLTATVSAQQRERAAEQRSLQAQRMASVGQLAAGVAHDFNNVLGIILNYTAFAAERAADLADGEIAADLARVRLAAERAAGLTQQLLTFTREDTAKPQVLDVNTSITEARDLLARTIGGHIDLVAVGSPTPLTIYADPGRVQQILVNLAVNARDAMPDGGTLLIEATVADLDGDPLAQPPRSGGRYVRLVVSDTGVGMSRDVVERIFEPFYTTKPRGQGTGLGLATVYGIVTDTGGSISVSSEPGVGTTFQVDFPLVDAPETTTVRADETAPRGDGQTILVAEDEPVLRDVVARILTGGGYRVRCADGAAGALELHAGHGCDLLLTDVVMPDMSGRDLAARLRRRHPDLPVIYMSGYTDGLLGAAHLLESRIAFIQKPFTAQQLLEQVHRVLSTPHPADASARRRAAGPSQPG